MPVLRRVAVVVLLGTLITSCGNGTNSLTIEQATAEAEDLALDVAQVIEPDAVGIAGTLHFGCVEDTRDQGVETHFTVDAIPTRTLITGPVVGLLEGRGFYGFVYGPDEPNSELLHATGPDFTVELRSNETTTDIVVISRGCTVDG